MKIPKMIFWWSESKLIQFIDECILRGYIHDEFDSLNEEINNVNKSADKNARNIKALAKAFNDLKEDKPNGDNNIPVDLEEIVAIIDDKISFLLHQNDKTITLIRKKMEDVERSQFTQTEVEIIAKKIVRDNQQQLGVVNTGELGKIKSTLDDVEKKITHISGNVISEADVLSIVEQYGKNSVLSEPVIDENSLATRIKAECIEATNNVIDQNSAAINNKITLYSSEIQKILKSLKGINYNNVITRLQDDYEEEKRKSDSLSGIVKSQEASIDLLMTKISELTKRVEVLEQAGGDGEPPHLHHKLVFGENSIDNESNLDVLLSQAKTLKERITSLCSNSEDVYIKLVDNLIDKIGKLIVKDKEKDYSSDKLANEVCKILKQTIIKGMSQEKVKTEIQQYMEDCGIRKLDWKIGKKIFDNDYEYLEEPIIYVDVNDENEAETIMAIIQDTYIIDYIEDDEKYEAIIPGMYRIGRYKR